MTIYKRCFKKENVLIILSKFMTLKCNYFYPSSYNFYVISIKFVTKYKMLIYKMLKR